MTRIVDRFPDTRSNTNITTQKGTRKQPSKIRVRTRLLLSVAAVTHTVSPHKTNPATRVFHHYPCRLVRTEIAEFVIAELFTSPILPSGPAAWVRVESALSPSFRQSRYAVKESQNAVQLMTSAKSARTLRPTYHRHASAWVRS